MKTIASFTVNHDRLEKGMYLSRVDGDVVTYDVRMKKPNGGDYLGNGELHTIEHLFAHERAVRLVSDSLAYIADFEGEIPGSKRAECGNYAEHDLSAAKKTAREMLSVLKNWNENDLTYKE